MFDTSIFDGVRWVGEAFFVRIGPKIFRDHELTFFQFGGIKLDANVLDCHFDRDLRSFFVQWFGLVILMTFKFWGLPSQQDQNKSGVRFLCQTPLACWVKPWRWGGGDLGFSTSRAGGLG